MAQNKAAQEKNLLKKIFNPLISSFTKEKWQSRNPEVRKKAVQELPVSDQKNLSQIAMNDTDESIRAIAANKLSDLDLLQTIVMKGTNGTVKEAAQNRLLQLICGLKHPVPDFDVREKMIRGSRNSTLLEFVSVNADEAQLRELTIKKISRDPLLGDIALQDENPHIRQLAAQQIAKRSTLERVTKNSRRKDKRVYKIVKNKLDHIIEDEQRPLLLAKEVVEICTHLEKLKKRNLLLQEKLTFENYVTRWSEIQNFADPQTTERYHAICSDIIQAIDHLESKHIKEQDSIQKLETLLTSLSTAVDDLLNARENTSLINSSLDSPDNDSLPEKHDASNAEQETIKTAEKTIQNLGNEWDEEIKSLSQESLVSKFNAKFQSILDLADSETQDSVTQKQAYENSSDSLKKVQTLTEQAENMLSKSGFILEKTILALENKFQQQLNKNIIDDELEAIQSGFKIAVKTLKEKLSIQQKQANNFKEGIEKQSQEIQSLIDNGHVSKAETLIKSIIKEVEHSDLISNIDKQKYQDEIHKIQSQLGDLSSWRNWAHDNERDSLAIKAEKLAQQSNESTDLESEYSDITFQIKELRKQWKSMRSHTKEDLWQRFNNACNLAYENCSPFIDKQNEERKTNLKAREALCEQLENYILQMEWPTPNDTQPDETIDWIQVDKITRQARKEWAAIGFVERKHHKNISRRFDKSIDTIRSELKKIWQLNQDKFFELVQQTEALQETLDDDLSDAINKAKNFQKQWKEIGPVSPYQRNKLWKRFRKGCDVIFDKRQENINQKNQVNTDQLREKEAICENLEALNQQPLNLKDLEQAFLDIENLWSELVPQAKKISNQVNQRYKAALEIYHKKITALLLEQQNEQLDILKQQADLCTEIEGTEIHNSNANSDFNERWESLTSQLIDRTLLSQRFQAALDSEKSDKDTLIQLELKEKASFCLKYEILLGKETPDEELQTRMEMQVELLNSNLGKNRTEEGSDKAQITPFELQCEWYEYSNYSNSKSLQERFEKLLSE